MPSVAETCELEISSSLIGSAPDCSSLARFWAEVSVNPPEISEPLVGVDPFRVLGVVDRRRRDQLAVEHDREVLQRGFLADARQLRFLAALGDFLGHPLEDVLPRAR